MTNTIFFQTLGGDESCSSSCPSSRFSEVGKLPRYSAFNEALLALKRKFWSSYRPPLPPQARRIGENEATNSEEEHVNSSTFVHPAPQTDGEISECSNSEEEHVNSSTFVHPAPLDSNFKRFNIFELEAATMNFHPSMKLSGSCSMFMGFLNLIHPHALAATKLQMVSTVAVKKLPNGNQNNAKWLSKIDIMRTLDHPNLVKVVGYCSERGQRLLVSEFILGTSLKDHLSSRNSGLMNDAGSSGLMNDAGSSGLIPLTLSRRMKIAIGIARALAYLHNVSPPSLHGNIKPSNILLDLNFNVKLSNFELIKDPVHPILDHIDGLVQGQRTNVYNAPESVRPGELTTDTDAYGFGVVLLELLLGRRVAEKNGCMTAEFKHLKQARFSEELLLSSIDSQVEGQYTRSGAEHAVGLVSLCLHDDDMPRLLFMKYVVGVLETHFEKREEETLS